MNQFHEAIKHIRAFPAAFWVVIVATLINQIGNMAFVYLMIYANKHLNFTIGQASLTFGAFSISMFLAGIVGGSFIDRIGAARVWLVVLFGNGLTILTIPHFHQFYVVTFLCFIWGGFYGLTRPASQTIVSHLSTPGMHKITFSVYRLVVNLGMSIGPVIGGYLAAYSFPLIFNINGIANLIACSIIFFGLEKHWFAKNINVETKIKWPFKVLKHDRALSIFLLAMIPVSMIFFQHESTLPIFINRDLNLPLSFYGWLLTINTLMIVLFELPLNIATLKWSYRTNFMLGCFFITLGFAGMYFAQSAWHLALLAALWTIGEMILFPAASSYITELAPSNARGSYMSLFYSTFNIGLVLGPWSGAYIMEQIGASGLWVACGLWGMLSVIMFSYKIAVVQVPATSSI